MRQSGFLMPEFSDTSLKGLLGDAYYWAPKTGRPYTRRGISERARLAAERRIRAKPWENVNIHREYFGVIDRGLPDSTGAPVKQGGHSAQLVFDSLLNGDGAALRISPVNLPDVSACIAPTFGEAVNSEEQYGVLTTFPRFSANFAGRELQNFVNAQPEVAVILPTRRKHDSVPWINRLSRACLFGMDAFAGGPSQR